MIIRKPYHSNELKQMPFNQQSIYFICYKWLSSWSFQHTIIPTCTLRSKKHYLIYKTLFQRNTKNDDFLNFTNQLGNPWVLHLPSVFPFFGSSRLGHQQQWVEHKLQHQSSRLIDGTTSHGEDDKNNNWSSEIGTFSLNKRPASCYIFILGVNLLFFCF